MLALLGLFDVALTDKDGYFVGDVALRFWVREDGDGDVPPARGASLRFIPVDRTKTLFGSQHWWFVE